MCDQLAVNTACVALAVRRLTVLAQQSEMAEPFDSVTWPLNDA